MDMNLNSEFQIVDATSPSVMVVVPDCFHVEGTMPKEIKDSQGVIYCISYPLQPELKWKHYTHRNINIDSLLCPSDRCEYALNKDGNM